MKNNTVKTRQHETVMEMPASPADVWRALTEASSVATWYALEARIDPRVGGEYWVSWGEGMEGRATIDVFEPERHLRQVYERQLSKGPDGESEKVPQAIDFYLESNNSGGTTLRLVHTGFLDSADWDGEYNGTKLGWTVMLRVLQYSLRGKPKTGTMRWLYHMTKLPPTQAWTSFTELLKDRETVYVAEPSDFCAVWNEFGDGLVYEQFGGQNGKTSVTFYLVLFGDAVKRIDEAVALWQERLESVPQANAAT